MASVKSRERMSLEKRLGVLGTLGNNAPFIGLFGTVLGIIRSFADLAQNQGGGAAVVMRGISEALVATAVGLLVAIPAVIAYNIFQGRVRRTMGRIDTMAHLILSSHRQRRRPGTARSLIDGGGADALRTTTAIGGSSTSTSRRWSTSRSCSSSSSW